MDPMYRLGLPAIVASVALIFAVLAPAALAADPVCGQTITQSVKLHANM